MGSGSQSGNSAASRAKCYGFGDEAHRSSTEAVHRSLRVGLWPERPVTTIGKQAAP